MVVATLNRTLKALAFAKVGAEYVLGWLPRGAHDWRRFLTPDEVRLFLSARARWRWRDRSAWATAPWPTAGRSTTDASVNYMMTVERP